MIDPEREAAVKRVVRELQRTQEGWEQFSWLRIAERVAVEIERGSAARDALWDLALDAIGVEVEPPNNIDWRKVCPKEEKP